MSDYFGFETKLALDVWVDGAESGGERSFREMLASQAETLRALMRLVGYQPHVMGETLSAENLQTALAAIREEFQTGKLDSIKASIPDETPISLKALETTLMLGPEALSLIPPNIALAMLWELRS